MATQTAPPGGKEVWLGAMVPKRWAKRAVTRNLIKRQIYSVASRYETRLPAAAHLVRLRSGFDRQQFLSAASDQLRNAVRAEIELLFNKAMSAMLQESP
jgi:ribonuclease P protein component